jgi:group I intron endonuclease
LTIESGERKLGESFIYLWYDSQNKKYYLGKHKGSPDDWYTHSSYVWPSFTKDNIPKGVRRRILAYGTEKEIAKLEHEFLLNRKNKCWHRYYNLGIGDGVWIDMTGPNNHMYGKKHTEETRKKMSAALKGRKNPMSGRKHTEETLKKLRVINAGSGNPFYGRKHTEETLEKMRSTQKARHERLRRDK